ncbi:hypothetical protein NP777_06400 [Streptomyces sp. RCU064]|uniref:Uncharacterized protein n=1 Tax=Streptomyces rugosispiralis TaxID=2967341 RepID=A0ABT1URX8_9ACTN|nr:hypothetical protein [Streptomyces rugosispiralis]MCQ8187883.1 hypothetical protein [Streptomyces rugosispiralis]
METGADDARDVEYRIGPAVTDDDGNSGNTSCKVTRTRILGGIINDQHRRN